MIPPGLRTFPGTLILLMAVISSVPLAGCGSSERQSAAAEQDKSGSNQLSLHDAMAMALQNDVLAHQTLPADDPWNKIAHGLVSVNRDQLKPSQRDAGIIDAVRTAYIHAAAADKLDGRVAGIIAQEKARLQRIPEGEERQQLQARLARIEENYVRLLQAKPALAALTGIQNPSHITLADGDRFLTANQALPDRQSIIEKSLMDREEMKIAGIPDDNVINGMIAESRKSIPPSGAGEKEWQEFSSSFAGGLERIFALKLDFQNAAVLEKFELLQQQAVATAIVAQVTLAHQQMKIAQDSIPPAPTKTDYFSLAENQINYYGAVANYQRWAQRLQSVASTTIIPPEYRQADVAFLSGFLAENEGYLTENLASAMPDMIYQQPAIAPVVYHPVDKKGRIPLPQKLSMVESPDQSIFKRFIGNSRKLKISSARMRTLLDMPVTEPR